MMEVSTDGQHMITVGEEMATRVVVWELASGRVPAAVSHEQPVTCIGVCGDKPLVASGAPGEVKIWSLTTGEVQHTVPVPDWTPSSVAFLDRGDSLRLLVGTEAGMIGLLDAARLLSHCKR